MTEKVVTFRFRQYCPPTEMMSQVMARIADHAWAGETGFPARLEWFVSKDSKPAHFPVHPVCYTREDADALLASIDALDAIVCAVPVDPAARKAAAAAAKFKAAQEKAGARPKPDPASLVKPSLRFLLEADAREEACRLADRLAPISAGDPALAALADTLAEDFPIMARADDALDGQIREMLRQAGTLPRRSHDAFDMLAVRRVAWSIKDGNVEFLTPRFVAGKRERASVDRALMEIVDLRRWMAVRGKPPLARQADPGPPVPVADAPGRRFAAPASPAVDDCPF